jgi:hypothetical protein
LEYILSGIFYSIHDQMTGTGSPDYFRIRISSDRQSSCDKGAYDFRFVSQELVLRRLVYIQSCPRFGVLLCP